MHTETVQVQHSEACNPTYHIPPPVQLPTPSDEVDAESGPPDDTSVCENPASATELSCAASAVLPNDCEKVIEERNDCDMDPKSSSKCKVEENAEDSLLWMRTEALLGSQSFNLVRRRMSTSEST